MVEAGPGNSGHKSFHREMRIEVYSEIPDHVDWLDDIGADSETSVGCVNLAKPRNPIHLLGVQLETFRCTPVRNRNDSTVRYIDTRLCLLHPVAANFDVPACRRRISGTIVPHV